MSRKEVLIKWKTVEEQTPLFPDGVIFIKEDTSIEYPWLLFLFHRGDIRMERENSGRMLN